MSHVFALMLGPLVGLVVGWASSLLPITAILRTVAAGTVASLGASIVSAVLWLALPPPAVEIKAVSIGLAEVAIVLAASGVASAVLHVALGQWATRVGSEFLGSHRPLVVGALAGLGGAVSFALGTGVVRMGR